MMTNDSHRPIDIDAFRQRDPLVNVNPPKPEHAGHLPTKAVARDTNNLGESVYLIEIVKGLFLTLGKMMGQLVGLKKFEVLTAEGRSTVEPATGSGSDAQR